jgi:hypothetical protein
MSDNNNSRQQKKPRTQGGAIGLVTMQNIQGRATARNDFNVTPFVRPRIEPERDGHGWLVLLPNGHGCLHGDRRQALREFETLVRIERTGR